MRAMHTHSKVVNLYTHVQEVQPSQSASRIELAIVLYILSSLFVLLKYAKHFNCVCDGVRVRTVNP